MEEPTGVPRLEGMSEDFDEAGPEQEEVEAHAADVVDEPEDGSDDDSDFEGHLFQRR